MIYIFSYFYTDLRFFDLLFDFLEKQEKSTSVWIRTRISNISCTIKCDNKPKIHNKIHIKKEHLKLLHLKFRNVFKFSKNLSEFENLIIRFLKY